MPAKTVDGRTRAARGAVFTVFGLNGVLLAMWVVHIPVITDRTGVSHSTLGMFILAAGNLGTGTAATDMSRVFGLGYFGLLAGPAVIGWLTELVPLTAAMLVPVVAVLLCCWKAGVVAPAAVEIHRDSRATDDAR
ncbi:hypothetical protein ACFYT3_18405 [Nocardia amikacinitolerans]|uniref:hypothetical protein n=1 Tax=Nocardia amikacinitolerans TaxID=756689 RepID=UPI00369DB744